MERKGSSEKFQPRMVASFSRPQMESVGSWLKRVVLDRQVLDHGITFTEAFDRIFETEKLDEKGKTMDEKSRNRLRYGLATINILHKEGMRLSQIIGTIQVWQTTPDENKLEIRYDTIQPRNFGLRRY